MGEILLIHRLTLLINTHIQIRSNNNRDIHPIPLLLLLNTILPILDNLILIEDLNNHRTIEDLLRATDNTLFLMPMDRVEVSPLRIHINNSNIAGHWEMESTLLLSYPIPLTALVNYFLLANKSIQTDFRIHNRANDLEILLIPNHPQTILGIQ